MKRVFSLLLVLAMTCCLFVSCSSTPEEVIDKADAALLAAPYQMTVSMNFSSDNEELNEVLSYINLTMPIVIDGENMSMQTSTEVMGEPLTVLMSVVDRTMYVSSSMQGIYAKMKCPLSDEQYKETTEDAFESVPLSTEDFETLTIKTEDGRQIVTCEGLSATGQAKLQDLIGDKLGDVAVDIGVSNVSFSLSLKDDKYEKMTLGCTYTMTVEEQTCTFTMQLNADFAYDGIAAVTAPADADSYRTVDFSEING